VLPFLFSARVLVAVALRLVSAAISASFVHHASAPLRRVKVRDSRYLTILSGPLVECAACWKQATQIDHADRSRSYHDDLVTAMDNYAIREKFSRVRHWLLIPARSLPFDGVRPPLSA
jgi:hypothetical protein